MPPRPRADLHSRKAHPAENTGMITRFPHGLPVAERKIIFGYIEHINTKGVPKKKLTALALALSCLLALASAQAQTLPGTAVKVYEEPGQAYTTVYPETWLLLDKATVRSTLQSLKNSELDIGFKPDIIEQCLPALENANIAMFMDLYLHDNYNLVYNQDDEYARYRTADLLESFPPLIEEQYKQIYQNHVMLTRGELVRYGDKEYLHTAVAYQGTDGMRQADQFYLLHGDKMFIFTFTLLQEDGQLPTGKQQMIEQVLTQFQVH